MIVSSPGQIFKGAYLEIISGSHSALETTLISLCQSSGCVCNLYFDACGTFGSALLLDLVMAFSDILVQLEIH